MGKAKIQPAWLVGLIFCMSLGSTFAPSFAATLPNCSRSFGGKYIPVEKEVRAAVVKYYGAKKLGPITIAQNREQVKEVKLWTVGVHWCLNAPEAKAHIRGLFPKPLLPLWRYM